MKDAPDLTEIGVARREIETIDNSTDHQGAPKMKSKATDSDHNGKMTHHKAQAIIEEEEALQDSTGRDTTGHEMTEEEVDSIDRQETTEEAETIELTTAKGIEALTETETAAGTRKDLKVTAIRGEDMTTMIPEDRGSGTDVMAKEAATVAAGETPATNVMTAAHRRAAEKGENSTLHAIIMSNSPISHQTSKEIGKDVALVRGLTVEGTVAFKCIRKAIINIIIINVYVIILILLNIFR